VRLRKVAPERDNLCLSKRFGTKGEVLPVADDLSCPLLLSGRATVHSWFIWVDPFESGQ